jgi:hypothetical protein
MELSLGVFSLKSHCQCGMILNIHHKNTKNEMMGDKLFSFPVKNHLLNF